MLLALQPAGWIFQGLLGQLRKSNQASSSSKPWEPLSQGLLWVDVCGGGRHSSPFPWAASEPGEVSSWGPISG